MKQTIIICEKSEPVLVDLARLLGIYLVAKGLKNRQIISILLICTLM